MRRVLLTGFEPVSPATVNPAWDAVDLLARTWEGPGEVIARRLPAVFGEAPHRLRMSIAKHIPDAVVMTATAPGLPGVAVERIAINLDDATLPDNAGSMPVDQPIVEDGPAGLWSTLPDRAIVERLSAAGVPCGLSTSAGTYIGNHTFYQVQRELMNWGVPSGLLRLPASPALGLGPEVPAFSEEEMAAALRIVVLTVMAELGDDAAHILLAQETAGASAPGGPTAAPVAPPAPTPEPDPTPEPVPVPAPENTAAPSGQALPASFDPEDEDVATQPFLMPISEPIYQPDPAAEVPALEPEDSPSFTQVVFPDRATAAAATAAPEEPAPATAPLHVAPRVPSMDAPEPAAATEEAHEPVQDAESESEPRTEEPAPPALTWEQIIGGRG
ncbi:pyroglutamyl-peptidase I family protein [Demequina lignilytica]|uniref:Pyrrolidone-carboxylate peptidase n=1 Tax=Demequina lignilytica TaxID=3051663 RepID=A0AB35ML65_9MICO|nr:hypothetical protein [Demequina sp. SYSU T0a273]MDN4484487.1 hypothetical protein [Demequina sp. SYSU T0a273]